MDVGSDQAWVTLATNDSYALGALVLARSLRRAETTRKIVIMITHGVSDNMKAQLSPPFDEVVSVELLDSDDPVNLELLERPELGITFTKIHCWKLTQFSKCVFLDADTMVLKNCDELFDREEFSAAPDAGWPDCFNSGVFVFVPSLATFTALTEHAKEHGSFDGGDQGLLNTYFSSWATKDISKHLPFLYNMVATATYTYLPAYKRFGHNVKVVHFIGVTKPWHVKFDAHGQPLSGPHEAHTLNHLQQWWRIFFDEVKPKMAGIATVESIGAKEPEVVEAPAEPVARAHDPGSADNREDWEVGRPDYMGSASFDNIMKKIETSLQSPKAD